MDLNEDFKDFFEQYGDNIRFETGDIYRLDKKYINQFNGILCLQTLSWLPDYKEPVTQICGLGADWIAMSMLMYEGKINYNIQLENYESLTSAGDYTHSYYNIYSIPLMKEVFAKNGYSKFFYQKFEMDIDLPKPNYMDMGTYTIKTIDKERLQISGALLMPWYFIYAEK